MAPKTYPCHAHEEEIGDLCAVTLCGNIKPFVAAGGAEESLKLLLVLPQPENYDGIPVSFYRSGEIRLNLIIGSMYCTGELKTILILTSNVQSKN